jgi:hypothetical protein
MVLNQAAYISPMHAIEPAAPQAFVKADSIRRMNDDDKAD